jgi:hypothetical protein
LILIFTPKTAAVAGNNSHALSFSFPPHHIRKMLKGQMYGATGTFFSITWKHSNTCFHHSDMANSWGSSSMIQKFTESMSDQKTDITYQTDIFCEYKFLRRNAFLKIKTILHLF